MGNEGAVNQLFEWLKDWDDVHIRGSKKEIPQNGSRFQRGGGWQE